MTEVILLKKIRAIFSHNWLAIFYFNFRMLPFRQAIKLPFDFYYGVRFESLSGNVELRSPVLYRGMIKIGGRGSEMFSRTQSVLDIKGIVSFVGCSELGHGILLRVEKQGKLNFGDNVRIGALSKIFCVKEINFGNEIDFSWECQIFDTNFHFIKNTESGEFDTRDGEVWIGSKNWIGNRVTVMKGTRTPSNFVVASNSLCNRDYLDMPEFSIAGGIPIRLLRTSKCRVFESSETVPGF